MVNYNNNALNTIYNGMNVEQIKLISSCESVKEAWDILQTRFEGSDDVKRNKLLTLATRFENLHMLEEESLFDFYTKLCEIANESFVLGEKIPEFVLVRKIIRSLPHRFQPKSNAIEESKNLDNMIVEELMGYPLLAFEMNLKQSKNGKTIAFKLALEKTENVESHRDDEEDELALPIKNFHKFLKKASKQTKSRVSGSKASKGKIRRKPSICMWCVKYVAE